MRGALVTPITDGVHLFRPTLWPPPIFDSRLKFLKENQQHTTRIYYHSFFSHRDRHYAENGYATKCISRYNIGIKIDQIRFVSIYRLTSKPAASMQNIYSLSSNHLWNWVLNRTLRHVGLNIIWLFTLLSFVLYWYWLILPMCFRTNSFALLDVKQSLWICLKIRQ